MTVPVLFRHRFGTTHHDRPHLCLCQLDSLSQIRRPRHAHPFRLWIDRPYAAESGISTSHRPKH
jgi:hypothetical protein